MKGFISYAQEDKKYVDLLIKGIKTHAKASKLIDWELWSKNAVLAGEDWKQSLQNKLAESEFAILFLSANFFASDYVQEHELRAFLQKEQTGKYHIFPIYLTDFNYSKLTSINRFQFFRALGADYDVVDESRTIIPYARLVKFDSEGRPNENSYRDKYHRILVEEIEEAISKHNDDKLGPAFEAKIIKNTGLLPALEGLHPVEQNLQEITIRSSIIHDLHRVNCDRTNLIYKFKDFFERNIKLACQFHVIAADDLHRPSTFSERLIYELDEILARKGYTIYYKSMHPLGIEKQRIRLQFEEEAKKDFQYGFSKMAAPEQDARLSIDKLEDFANSQSPALQHDFIALIFSFDTVFFPKKFSLTDYLKWIRETFCALEHTKTKFLFFFVFEFDHKIKESRKGKFYSALKKFTDSAKKDTLLSRKFSVVKATDIVKWFKSHLDDPFKADVFVENLISYLDEKYTKKIRKKYFNEEDESFQMAFVQSVLDKVYRREKHNR